MGKKIKGRNLLQKGKKMYPLPLIYLFMPLFPLNWSFWNVINAIKNILGIWEWVLGVYKAPDTICKFLRCVDFSELGTSFYQLPS